MAAFHCFAQRAKFSNINWSPISLWFQRHESSLTKTQISSEMFHYYWFFKACVKILATKSESGNWQDQRANWRGAENEKALTLLFSFTSLCDGKGWNELEVCPMGRTTRAQVSSLAVTTREEADKQKGWELPGQHWRTYLASMLWISSRHKWAPPKFKKSISWVIWIYYFPVNNSRVVREMDN